MSKTYFEKTAKTVVSAVLACRACLKHNKNNILMLPIGLNHNRHGERKNHKGSKLSIASVYAVFARSPLIIKILRKSHVNMYNIDN